MNKLLLLIIIAIQKIYLSRSAIRLHLVTIFVSRLLLPFKKFSLAVQPFDRICKNFRQPFHIIRSKNFYQPLIRSNG